MAHFTLSKFKKAGQLAFLTGFIFILPSCGGGGGSGGGGTTQPITYSYKSFSEVDSIANNFYTECENNAASCTESNARKLLDEVLSEVDFFLSAIHIRVNTAGNLYCWYDSTSASYALTRSGNDGFESYSFGAQSGATVCGNELSGADVNGTNITLNVLSTPVYEYNLPGSVSGLVDIHYQNWGYTDSNLSETVFVGSSMVQRDISGTYWSGNQYVIGNVGELDYASSCSYSGTPRVCSDITSDNTLNADLLGGLTGFKTNTGDMPSSGTVSYRSIIMGKGIYGFTSIANEGNVPSVSTAGCLQANPAHNSCNWVTIESLSGDQFISVDFSSGTVSGNISTSNVYGESAYGSFSELTNYTGDAYGPTRLSISNLNISASISGNKFTGTVSNDHFSGNIEGFFYGPQAKEIGAVLRLDSRGKTNSRYATMGGAISVLMINGQK